MSPARSRKGSIISSDNLMPVELGQESREGVKAAAGQSHDGKAAANWEAAKDEEAAAKRVAEETIWAFEEIKLEMKKAEEWRALAEQKLILTH
ncbi:hypothetical protein NDU88_007149 [Pleurodeles waltl]|uniref:Uncharacterized protein n=1 Tax=Pleurodeles waltl TaxID=8319 RepID=A0AAV7U0F1_PLEWA|nr:hypothetical protein NDU88_007149 [Pleurodeles waltl]